MKAHLKNAVFKSLGKGSKFEIKHVFLGKIFREPTVSQLRGVIPTSGMGSEISWSALTYIRRAMGESRWPGGTCLVSTCPYIEASSELQYPKE